MRRKRIVFVKTNSGQPSLELDMRLSRRDEQALMEWGSALMKHEHDRLVTLLEEHIERQEANCD